MRISDWSSDVCSSDLSGHVDAPAEQQPEVQRAQAALDRALLNLGYTTVRAPQAGTVTKVNQLQVGDFVSASRPVFTLVGQRLWVERSEERRVGKECVRTCRSRWSRYP